MTAMQCLLCLELIEDPVSSIKIDSAEWKEQCIEIIIEKHLWPMATLISKSSWLCLTCWQTLHDFHTFYRRLEDAHLYYECFVKSEHEIEIENSILMPQVLVAPEARLDANCMIYQDHYNDDEDGDVSKSSVQDEVPTITAVIKTDESVVNVTVVDDEKEMDEDYVPMKLNILDPTINKNPLDISNAEDIVPTSKLTYRPEMDEDDVPIKANMLDATINKNSLNVSDTEEKTEKHKSTHHIPKPSLAKSPPQEIRLLKAINTKDGNSLLLLPLSDDAKTQSCDKLIAERFQPDAHIGEDYDAFFSKYMQLICALCKEPFMTYAKLRKHFTSQHKQKVYVLCCGRKHSNRRDLFEHIKSHLYPDFFKCTYCPRVLKERRHYRIHQSIHEGQMFRCEVCIKYFSNKAEFDKHTQAHYPNEFACSHCNQTFDKKYQLTRHQAVEHSNKNESPTLDAEKETKEKNANEAISSIQIEINTTALDENSQMVMDPSFEIDENDSLPKEFQQKSDSEESEDMEKYLPQTDPTDYDEFLAKHIKFNCSVCQEVCRNFAMLRHHYTTVHRQMAYVFCCGKKHASRSFLADHINVHLNPEYFKCYQCSKTFKERRGLISHIAGHKGNKYRCVECRRSFSNKYKFNAHKLTHASKEIPECPCPECGKVFGNKMRLAQHQKTIHDNKYVKLCDICGASFRSSVCFKSHMDNHRGVTAPSYACDICGRILAGTRSLRVHKLKMHFEGAVRPYTCHICSKSVETRGFLNTHMRRAHSTTMHKCSICGKGFKALKSLKTHMVTHTGVPLYTCAWCPKTFNSSGNLGSHRRRIHPKEYEEWKSKQYLGGLPPTLKDTKMDS